ncbi:Uncharacterized protein PBTT_10445 [Plasmodiophora brassicae]
MSTLWTLVLVGACVASIGSATNDGKEDGDVTSPAARTRLGIGAVLLCTAGCIAGTAVCCVPVVGPAVSFAASTAIVGVVTGGTVAWALKNKQGEVMVDGVPYGDVLENVLRGNLTVSFDGNDAGRKAAVLDVLKQVKIAFTEEEVDMRARQSIADVASDAKWAFAQTAARALNQYRPPDTEHAVAAIDTAALVRDFVSAPASAFLEWDCHSQAFQFQMFLSWVSNHRDVMTDEELDRLLFDFDGPIPASFMPDPDSSGEQTDLKWDDF